jgi:hypothetical protein
MFEKRLDLNITFQACYFREVFGSFGSIHLLQLCFATLLEIQQPTRNVIADCRNHHCSLL